tara:strand:+ start:308 stop:1714 length:1407 start_codon:yes stop_codon:yes gene_type:complete
MSDYKATIGLEIHAEMNTKTKMFCACANNPFVAEPNTHICSICTAQPGTLPAVNEQAVRNVLLVGTAVDGDLADFTEFDRKNYFYPDIPKAYQISQYKYPLVSNGSLGDVDLTRIHMEEDTATSTHMDDYSLVDFNRAGVPLMELVTEPVIHDAETAMAFARELQLLLRTLGVSGASLEKGEMRIEANISVSKTDELGTKVEVKNLNSFKIVGSAIDYEIARQIQVLENGEKVVQETRGWNETTSKTFSQRSKETADDYRYFPDPDIPKYKLSELEGFDKESLKSQLPELPWEKRDRYAAMGIKSEAIEFFLQNPIYNNFIESLLSDNEKKNTLAANYLSSDLAGLEKGEAEGNIANIDVNELGFMLDMVMAGDLSSRGAKDMLAIMYREGGAAESIANQHGLIQKSDEGELKIVAEKILIDNPGQVEEYKNGNEKLLQYFVGQGMRVTKGSANPGMLAKVFKELLEQ